MGVAVGVFHRFALILLVKAVLLKPVQSRFALWFSSKILKICLRSLAYQNIIYQHNYLFA